MTQDSATAWIVHTTTLGLMCSGPFLSEAEADEVDSIDAYDDAHDRRLLKVTVARNLLDEAVRRRSPALLLEAALRGDGLAAVVRERTARRPAQPVRSGGEAPEGLPPFLDATIADVSAKGRKRLRHVHTFEANFHSGAFAMELRGGLPPSADDHVAMASAIRSWTGAFEKAAGCRVLSLHGGSPWKGIAAPDAWLDVPEPVPVDDLLGLVSPIVADRMLPDWTDDEPCQIRYIFQVLPPSTVHSSRLLCDTWLTKGGLYWRTPSSRACVDAANAALRGWLAGRGQTLFRGIGNGWLQFDLPRPTPVAVAAA